MKILVTGASGFVGKYLVKDLKSAGYKVKSIDFELDLRVRDNCKKAVKNVDGVIHLAARFGGIGEIRKKPSEFFDDNIFMGLQLANEALKAGVKKYVGIGTVCSYPFDTPLPYKEEDLWKGELDEDVAPYGMSKKVLLFQLQMYYRQFGFKFAFLILTNLYGKGDKSTHVIPDLIRKFKKAKKENFPYVTLWGDGNQTREFLHVKDASRAIIKAFNQCNYPGAINVSSGDEKSIKEIADIIKKLTGYKGIIKWDTSMPSGHKKRRINCTKAKELLYWYPKIKFQDGIKECI